MPITFTTYDENDEEVTHTVASRKEVCGTCRGEGKSSAYLGAFSGEDMANDPDFFEDYMDGAYDRVCPECNGNRVVDVPDESRTPPEVWAKYVEDCDENAYIDRMQEAERRMGA